MRQVKIMFSILLGVVVLVFIAQNAAAVEYRFLIWQVEIRRSVILGLGILAGFIWGWVAGGRRGRAG